MDKHSGKISEAQDVQLIPASEADFLVLPQWFDSKNALREWGGPSLSYPLDAFLLMSHASQHEHYQSYALRLNDELLAFGQLSIVKHRAHLARLCVNPSRRGQGLGKRLVHDLVRQASKQAQINLISLFVYNSNAVALACYRKLGFMALPAPPSINTPEGCSYMLMHKQSSVKN